MPTAALIGAAGGISAFGQVMQGVQGQRASNIEAQQYERQAQEIGVETGAKISAQDAQAHQVNSAVAANAGASGVTGGGSAGAVRNANTNDAVLRDAYTRYSGQLAESQALYAASNAKYEGQQKFWGGVVGAGSSLLTTALMMKGGGFGSGSGSGASAGGGTQ